MQQFFQSIHDGKLSDDLELAAMRHLSSIPVWERLTWQTLEQDPKIILGLDMLVLPFGSRSRASLFRLSSTRTRVERTGSNIFQFHKLSHDDRCFDDCEATDEFSDSILVGIETLSKVTQLQVGRAHSLLKLTCSLAEAHGIAAFFRSREPGYIVILCAENQSLHHWISLDLRNGDQRHGLDCIGEYFCRARLGWRIRISLQKKGISI